MNITFIGWVLIPLIVIYGYKSSIRNFILFTLFTSFFTSTSVIYINFIDFHIGLQQFAAMVLIFKFIYEVFIIKKIQYRKINIYLILFSLYTFISIFIPLIFDKSNNLVIGVSSHMKLSPVVFSFSNITQFLYLLLGVIIYSITYTVFDNEQTNNKQIYSEKVNIYKEFSKVIYISALSISILGILQTLIDQDLFNFIFRQYNFNNQQVEFMNIVVNRPSGPTGEPSFYMLALVPMFSYIIYNYKFYLELVGSRYCYIISVIVMLLPMIVSKSSSFIVGISIFVFILLVKMILDIINNYDKFKSTYFKSENRKKIIFIISVTIITLIIGILILINTDIFRELIYKVKGHGVSGRERTQALSYHLKVFRDNLIFGVGFGSLRSKDLFSTWLPALGSVGFSLFIVFFIRQIYYLFKINTSETISLAILILTGWGMMFVSIPEPYYLYLWIYFAVSECIIKKKLG